MSKHETDNHVVCPYCGAEDDDTGQILEGGNGPDGIDCDGCGKSFMYEADFTVHFTTWKADCLNGAPHDWKRSQTPCDGVPYVEVCRNCHHRRWAKGEETQ